MASTNMSIVEDQSSSWGTPFVPSNTKVAQLNDAFSTIVSDYNMATILSNSSVNINAVVAKNLEVSTNLQESFVISNPVMTKNSEVDAIVPNSSVNSNPAVTKNPEVGADGDKFVVSAMSTSTVMSTKADNEVVALIKSCTTVAPECIVNCNPTVVDTTKKNFFEQQYKFSHHNHITNQCSLFKTK